jgi:hypothetical protein
LLKYGEKTTAGSLSRVYRLTPENALVRGCRMPGVLARNVRSADRKMSTVWMKARAGKDLS